MTAAVLPPIPRPPHDPTSLLCDARVGWPRVEIEHAQVTSGALTLARSPDSLRRFTEPSGSFGGLRPPANVASCGDAIWLLDRDRGVLRRFDPCACAFEDVPCGGTTEGPMAEGPNVLRAPVGLAAFQNRLFVGDAGNSRRRGIRATDARARGRVASGSLGGLAAERSRDRRSRHRVRR